jgi:hypothetical protein
LILAFLSLAFFSGCATSGGGGKSFADVDSNGDGRIDMEEHKANGGTESEFKTADENGDGLLTEGEFGPIGAGRAR